MDFIEQIKINTLQVFLENDMIYQKDIKNLGELKLAYEQLDIEQGERIFLNDLIALEESSAARAISLAYLAGIKDCLHFLSGLGILEFME